MNDYENETNKLWKDTSNSDRKATVGIFWDEFIAYFTINDDYVSFRKLIKKLSDSYLERVLYSLSNSETALCTFYDCGAKFLNSVIEKEITRFCPNAPTIGCDDSAQGHITLKKKRKLSGIIPDYLITLSVNEMGELICENQDFIRVHGFPAVYQDMKGKIKSREMMRVLTEIIKKEDQDTFCHAIPILEKNGISILATDKELLLPYDITESPLVTVNEMGRYHEKFGECMKIYTKDGGMIPVEIFQNNNLFVCIDKCSIFLMVMR